MIGQILIERGKTTMKHGEVVFGTATLSGTGYAERWRVYIPCLNFVAVEKSRIIADNLLVDCYCAQEVEYLDGLKEI